MDDFVTEMKKVVAWKDQTEKTIASMQTTIEKMKEDFNLLHQGVLGKINQYDDQIKEVDSELKAVGKVFKDVIPVFTNSVKDLHQISQDLKGGKDGNRADLYSISMIASNMLDLVKVTVQTLI